MAPSINEPSNRHSNGSSVLYPTNGNIKLVPGFYVPTVAFFEPRTEAVDVATTRRHAIRLAEAGVTGLVTHGR
jgi:4-hydroxy-2-oxoglutarate aldolase